ARLLLKASLADPLQGKRACAILVTLSHHGLRRSPLPSCGAWPGHAAPRYALHRGAPGDYAALGARQRCWRGALGGVLPGWRPARPCILPIRSRAESYWVSCLNSATPQFPGPAQSPSSASTLAFGATPYGMAHSGSSPLPTCASAASAWGSQNVMS